MKSKRLSDTYLSALMLELSLLLRAGLTTADGLRLLLEDEDDPDSRDLLRQVAAEAEAGRPLSAALAHTGRFPHYLLSMTQVGERTGRLEESCRALADYYDDRQRLNAGLRAALGYPLLLLLLMLAVVVVLLVKVLPIFNGVFQQLGLSLGAGASAMLRLGSFLSGASLAFAILLGLVLALSLLFWLRPSLRESCFRRYCDWRGNRGLTAQLSACRFAAAMTMAMRSGLHMEEAVELATGLAANSRQAEQSYRNCLRRLEAGASLSAALDQEHIFPALYCRMLALGEKSGNADAVMAEISRRLNDSLEQELSRVTGRVEPTLVVITSLLVGAILLSVMLPLMNIMSALG